jgi:WD40 repeat protein
VCDLAINTDKFQLISLGIDKVVKVWDIRNFRCLQTIVDKTSYRPENVLTGLHFNPSNSSLILTSRKINVWPFKAQEEMSSSHDCSVTKCQFNDNFASVISTDENSNVHVWSIADGRLNFKFSEAHGTNRISAICFDFSGRRLITGGHDGSLKMWNFSNGQCLKDFNYDVEPKEVSDIIYIDEESGTRYNFIATVGWDKKIYIWPDENEPVVSWIKSLPKESQVGHTDDILCVEYCKDQKFLVSGGLFGQLFVWMFETGVIRALLHETDPSCNPVENAAAEGKSVEGLAYLQSKQLLLSITADGFLRFWDLVELTQTSKTKLAHLGKDAVTCAAKSSDGSKLATCDESGNMKLTDISDVYSPQEIFFVNAHSALVNCVHIFMPSETTKEFIITGSVDRNVKLFTIRGEVLGYFGQGNHWDLDSLDGLTMAPPPVHPQIFLRKKWREKNGLEGPLDEEQTEETKDDEGLRAMNAYFIRQSVRKGKAKASEAGTFKKIDLSRLKVEKVSCRQLPGTVEDLYRQRTGLDLRRERPHHKQR